MEHSVIKIKSTLIDRVIDIIGGAGVIALFILVIINYESLPDLLPQNFSITGKPYGVGEKSYLWVLAIAAFSVYFTLTVGLRYPHRFNLPVTITSENAVRQYRNAITMLRILKTVIVLSLLYFTYAAIQIGHGARTGLGIMFLPVFLLLVFGTIAFAVYRMLKLR